jgi:ubiquinone/menaquinone biosynthesis C-methylase UbiE
MRPDLFQLHAELELHHWWFTARGKIVRALVERVVPPGARVIDVGCGTGATARLWSDPHARNRVRRLDAHARG